MKRLSGSEVKQVSGGTGQQTVPVGDGKPAPDAWPVPVPPPRPPLPGPPDLDEDPNL